ncbi:MAG: PqqD family protein [Deltaproteobacteria bacterium]|nr:PqqD family protein [Deltaproteobacteria bacterium]
MMQRKSMKRRSSGSSANSRSKWAHLLGKYMVHHPDIAWQVVEGETIIVIPGPQPVMHVLNETGTFLWKSAEQGDKTIEDLVAVLRADYDVGPIRARRDVCELVQDLERVGAVLLRDEPGVVEPLWE